jgi:hypothetical protein
VEFTIDWVRNARVNLIIIILIDIQALMGENPVHCGIEIFMEHFAGFTVQASCAGITVLHTGETLLLCSPVVGPSRAWSLTQAWLSYFIPIVAIIARLWVTVAGFWP